MKTPSTRAKSDPRQEREAAEAYLQAQSPPVRAGLRKLCTAIRAAVPKAELGMSYGIPAFRFEGRPVVWLAAFKQHSSFFPGAGAIRAHADLLKGYRISKGTIQFPPNQPLPADLVARLVRTRLAEMKLDRK